MEPNCVTFRNNKVRGMLFNNPVGRYTPVNPYQLGYTQQELDMRRKAEILQYNKTANGRLKKTQAWVNVVAGSTQRRRYSSYYIRGLVDGENNQCPQDIAIPTLSTSSGVPGPPILLYYDAAIPLYNYSTGQNSLGTQPSTTTSTWLTRFDTDVMKSNSEQNIFTLNIPRNSVLEPSETFSFTTSVALYVSGYTTQNGGLIEMSIPIQNLSLSIVFGSSMITLAQTPTMTFSAGFLQDLSGTIPSVGQFAGKIYMGEVTFSNIILSTLIGNTYDFYISYIPQIKLTNINSASLMIITNFKNNYLKMEQSNLVFSKSPSIDNINTFVLTGVPL
jgi:hypothetical protein